MFNIPHFLEYLAALLGFLAIMTRLRPQLEFLSMFFQTFFFLVQLAIAYIKNNPNQARSLKEFLGEVTSHYFTTHPEGQKMANASELDEKIGVVCTNGVCKVESKEAIG